MESGLDTATLTYVGMVIALVGPLLLIAIGLGRIKALRPASSFPARPSRPGYGKGQATGASIVLALMLIPIVFEPVEEIAFPVLTLLIIGPVFVGWAMPSRRSWFLDGLPLGALQGWIGSMFLSVVLVTMLGG